MKNLYESILSKRKIGTDELIACDLTDKLSEYGCFRFALLGDVDSMRVEKVDLKTGTIRLYNVSVLTTDFISYCVDTHSIHNIILSSKESASGKDTVGIQVTKTAHAHRPVYKLKNVNIDCGTAYLMIDNDPNSTPIELSHCEFVCSRMRAMNSVTFKNCNICAHKLTNTEPRIGVLSSYSGQSLAMFDSCTIKDFTCMGITDTLSGIMREKLTELGLCKKWGKKYSLIRELESANVFLQGFEPIDFDCTVEDILSPVFKNCKFGPSQLSHISIEMGNYPNNTRNTNNHSLTVKYINQRGAGGVILNDGYYTYTT